MYRGSRLAASFLLLLTGSAVVAVGLGVLPRAVAPGGTWIVVPVVVAAGIAHFVALAGIARGREWGRALSVGIAEVGGGLAIAALVAVLLGANPFTATGSLPEATARANSIGLLAWTIAMYLLLGASAGRVRLEPLGPSWSRPSLAKSGAA
jgi:hypothetical protein